MATGTGKTLTSLNCILEEYKKKGFYKFIVLVPSISLANQWEEEVIDKFRFSNAIVCSSKRPAWQKDLRLLGRNLFLDNDKDYAIILTYATFRSKNFNTIFTELFKNEFSKITLIADEAHTMGSPGFLKLMPNYINYRIGLSATPERQFDDIGEHEINTFFNTKPPQYTFVFDMKQAIDQGVLCKYYYYPKIVALETDELNKYLDISKKLIKFFDASTGKYQDNDYVNLLLIQRKNVIHKAKGKIVALDKIVKEIGVKDFKNAFIYVPEGNDPDYTEVDESANEEQDNLNESLIDVYTNSLYQNFKLKLKKFTGKTLDREMIIELFKQGKIDALLAMKCLDEGIDIPQTKYAIFCSSTGNPRQFVQRRGRVLRKHDDKEFAIIYDMIVKPILDITSTDDNLRKAEKNIFLSELKRFINFAALSENKSESLAELEEIAYALDIDIYALELEEMKKYNVI
jgi:superfamily II DNA or RNA helicase